MARLGFPQYLLFAALLALTEPLSQRGIDQCFKREINQGINPGFSKSAAKFGFNLFRKLVATQGAGESLVMSPYSVWSALCLAFFGSEGTTREELAHVLQLPSKTTTFTNWRSLQERLADSTRLGTTFLSTNKAYFSNHLSLDSCLAFSLPEVEMLNFGQPIKAANKINADVSAATNGEINDLVTAGLLTNVEFVLLNAVFFKGRWKTLFSKELTAFRTFHPASPSVGNVTVPMMATVGKFNYVPKTGLGASMVALPYEAGYSMLVLLPSLGVKVEAVVAELNRKKLWDSQKLLAEAEVQVVIPRFSLTTKLSSVLKQTLGELGLVDLFRSSANLASFSPNDLRLSSTLHQATVSVNEEGTVAAAATGVLGTRVGPIKFICDRPFIFLLVDDVMGVPILAGIYSGP